MAEGVRRMLQAEQEAILRLARERMSTIAAAESEIRATALEDMRFAYNLEEGQWPTAIRMERARDARPVLTHNKLRKFIAAVANRAATTKPAIDVKPVDDASDPAIARIYKDLIRSIEYASQADAIYAQAIQHAVAIGFGYWRLLTRYCEDSFDQELFLAGIDNPFSVYLDPFGRYGFIRSSLSRSEFAQEYPTANPVEFGDAGLGDDSRWWVEKDRIIIAEYFWKESAITRLAQVREPMSGQVQVLTLRKGLDMGDLTAQGYEILRTREAKGHQVKWAKLSGLEVLEIQDWPGTEVPIVEVCGDKVVLDGKIYKRSLIRDAKDPQQMYNFWMTAMTETIALAPKAPFLLTAQEIQGYEAMWDEAPLKNRMYLLFNQMGGRVPARERPPEVPTGALAMLKIADSDIKDVIGIFEPGLGDVSNERSGRAIMARQGRSDLGTWHFQEHLRQAIVKTGKLFIELIPTIYDTERVLRIRGEDGQEQRVPINQSVVDLQTGIRQIINDLSVGKYDIEADIRAYQTRREEATEMMIQTLQYAPSVAPYILDLIFKYSDWPGSDEIAARLRALLAQPPQAPPNGSSAANPAAPPMPMSLMAALPQSGG